MQEHVIIANKPSRAVRAYLKRQDAARMAQQLSNINGNNIARKKPYRRRQLEQTLASVKLPSPRRKRLARRSPTPVPAALQAPSSPVTAEEHMMLDFGPSVDYDYSPAPTRYRAPNREHPSYEKIDLYGKWNALIPTLLQPLLRFHASGTSAIDSGAAKGADAIDSGTANGAPITSDENCPGESCAAGARTHKVCFVFMTHFRIEHVKLCVHTSLPILLVRRGFFPSGPTLPGYAYSVDLLNLFLGLTRNGGNSVQSLAASLHEQHRDYGYVLRRPSGQPIQEGYRRTLQSALQWYDALLSLMDHETRRRIALERHELLYPRHNSTPHSTATGKQNLRGDASDHAPTSPPLHPHPATPQSPPATPMRARAGGSRRATVEDVPDEETFGAFGTTSNRSSADSDDPHGYDDTLERCTDSAVPPREGQPAWHPKNAQHHLPEVPPMAAPAASSAPSPSRSSTSGIRVYLDVAARLGLLTGQTNISQYLVGRCPKCFAVEKTGILLSAGGDFQCALDGNFSHRRNKKAGRSPDIQHERQAFVPKEFVDAVGGAIADARARPYESEVPKAALDQCESSHTAASGTQAKATGELHDDKGLMALVCRHDVPLFFCNIDTPGEQQKYSIALLIWLMLHLPDSATVMNLYDIGCVADRTKNAYDIMPAGMGDRIMFATSAMHAYAHQWECQLVFSPRMKSGLGLTDGEGVERLWSRLRKLIGHLRHVSKERRLIILDRHMEWIAANMRDDMGRWLSSKWKALALREHAAREEVAKSGRSAEFLRRQWKEQREHQLNVRRLTPPRLKKELEAVMALQDNIESVEEAITSTEAAVKRCRRGDDRVQSLAYLEELRETHVQLTAQADALYSALNVEETFPGVHDFGYDFVRTLVMAYDAKCIARRKMIGRFFEWDYLDQAVGGKGTPLGTHQHQRTVRAIQKRAPAIRNAIARYNTLCQQLRDLLPHDQSFPLPEELPTDLTKLKNDPTLLEDVWIVNLPAGTAPWLTDPNIRTAIRSQLILDRCAEERTRLAREEKQLYDWLVLEARAVANALHAPENILYERRLRREFARLEDLASSCANLQIPADRWMATVRSPMAAAEARAMALALAAQNDAGPCSEVVGEARDQAPLVPMAGISATTHVARLLDASSHGLQTPPATPYHQRTVTDAPDAAPDAAHDESLWSDNGSSGDEMDADDVQDFKTVSSSDVVVIDSDEEEEPALTYLAAQVQPGQVDTSISDVVRSASLEPRAALPSRRLVRCQQDGFKRITVEPDTLARLLAGEKANDDVMYAGIAALACRFTRHAHKIAVFQTYEYRLWCDSKKIPRLQGLLSRTEYWRRDIIILPIFSVQEKHWLLAVVYTKFRLIDFYDSYGSRLRWKEHVPNVTALLDGLERDAKARKLPLTWDTTSTGWLTAELVRFTAPHQENTLDCGLWVLAVVAAVLRGWRSTLLPADLMPDFRVFMFRLICDYIPAG